MSNLSIFCYKNYSELIRALNSLSTADNVIEVGTRHNSEYVLICRNESTSSLSLQALDSLNLKDVHAELLPAYFKQKDIRVEKNLVIVESSKLSVLFEATQNILSSSDFKCVEIQRSLTETGNGYAIFCNGSDPSIFGHITKAQICVIESPSETIKSYY